MLGRGGGLVGVSWKGAGVGWVRWRGRREGMLEVEEVKRPRRRWGR